MDSCLYEKLGYDKVHSTLDLNAKVMFQNNNLAILINCWSHAIPGFVVIRCTIYTATSYVSQFSELICVTQTSTKFAQKL